jgi:hypothetical protein
MTTVPLDQGIENDRQGFWRQHWWKFVLAAFVVYCLIDIILFGLNSGSLY